MVEQLKVMKTTATFKQQMQELDRIAERAKPDGCKFKSSSVDPAQDLDTIRVLAGIRRQLAKWQRYQLQQESVFCELKENEDYTINVSLGSERSDEGPGLVTSVSCKYCQRTIHLKLKKGKAVVSNWINHSKRCILIPCRQQSCMKSRPGC